MLPEQVRGGAGTWPSSSQAVHMGGNAYQGTLQVPIPGTYYLIATVSPAGSTTPLGAAKVPQTLPVELVVGPGQLDVAESPLLEPRKSEWTDEYDTQSEHMTPELQFLPDHASQYANSFAKSDDPFLQNPQ
jgi:hypothetical protein